jgi:hypothetical protein
MENKIANGDKTITNKLLKQIILEINTFRYNIKTKAGTYVNYK